MLDETEKAALADKLMDLAGRCRDAAQAVRSKDTLDFTILLKVEFLGRDVAEAVEQAERDFLD